MNILRIAWIAFILLLAGCTKPEAPLAPPTQTLSIDSSRVSVSGISSGAYMASQFHMAYSDLISGVGLIAGGPYWCAQGSLKTALGSCAADADVDLESIWAYAEAAAGNNKIAALENLEQARVWLFHGTNDVLVAKEVVLAAQSFYEHYIAAHQIAFVDSIDAVHGMPTLDAGVPCDEFATPYLNACEYDAAGAILQHLNGSLEPRQDAAGSLQQIDTTGYQDAELWDVAYLYVPESCKDGAKCGLHIAFHGCGQSAEFIGDAFATGAGYNEWADSNKLLVLYPQVRSSKLAPMNPLGCWDWWAYTDDDYATRNGAQPAAIKALIDSLAGTQP